MRSKSLALIAAFTITVLLTGPLPGVQSADLSAQLLANRQMVLRWNSADADWTLEQSDTLGAPGGWTEVNALTVAAGDSRSVTLTPSAAARFYRLRTSVNVPTAPSATLIDEAIARGAITEETGTLYKVFALFSDPRLPAAYQGDDSEVQESDALELALEKWSTFSEGTRTALFPFFIPPAYQGSWLNPTPPGGPGLQAAVNPRPEFDPNWASVPVSGGHVKVWYDVRDTTGHANAILCANALNNEIWPAITGLGILAPLSDANTGWFDGGDGRLDVYLVPLKGKGTAPPNLGETYPVSPSLQQKPAFLLISKTLSQSDMIGTLAHEFMHACQWAYPVKAISLNSYQWLKESTAQWAIDFVYPSNQLETKKAAAFMAEPNVSLDFFEENDKDHGYGSYLFFQYLSRAERPGLIKDIWAATTNYSDQLEAVNRSIPGGFKQQWPKFAKTLWNQEPIANKPASFKSWDSLTEIPDMYHQSADLPAGQAENTIVLLADQPNLTSTYYHFTFSTSETRSMMFHNTFYQNQKNNEDVSVQAMWKNAAGVWTEENWTNEWIGFCRDQKNQRLSDLVVIVSSAKWQSPGNPIRAAKAPRFMRNNIGCWGYQGTASRKTTNPNGGTGEISVSTSVRFGFRPSAQYSDPAQGRLRVFIGAPIYHDGGMEFSERYSDGGCTFTAGGSFPMPSIVVGGDTASTIVINNFIEAMPTDLRLEQEKLLGPDERSYTANGETIRLVTGQVSGQDCDPPTYITFPAIWMMTNFDAFEDGGRLPKARADGHLQGTLIDSADGSVFTWDLAPLPEP